MTVPIATYDAVAIGAGIEAALRPDRLEDPR
jgi:hypothetical protein